VPKQSFDGVTLLVLQVFVTYYSYIFVIFSRHILEGQVFSFSDFLRILAQYAKLGLQIFQKIRRILFFNKFVINFTHSSEQILQIRVKLGKS
jgi:hypothetical protein